MNIGNILSTVRDKGVSNQDRIDALRELEELRVNAMTRKEMGGHLGSTAQLPGQVELRRIIVDRGDQTEVRCEAADIVANTDIEAALKWCAELIERNT